MPSLKRKFCIGSRRLGKRHANVSVFFRVAGNCSPEKDHRLPLVSTRMKMFSLPKNKTMKTFITNTIFVVRQIFSIIIIIAENAGCAL